MIISKVAEKSFDRKCSIQVIGGTNRGTQWVWSGVSAMMHLLTGIVCVCACVYVHMCAYRYEYTYKYL